jgi:diguanylate cyclase (GGDEF)-like protein
MPDEYKKNERALVHAALKDPFVRIPRTYKADYLNYQTQQNHKYLLQINLLAQLAYASYTICDWFILADVQVLAVILKLGYTLVMTVVALLFYRNQVAIETFDRLLPTSIIGATLIWMYLLNLSDNPLTHIYQYSSLVFISLANLCVQVYFRPALTSSLLISLIITCGAYFNTLGHEHHFLLFILIYTPIFLFSLYISWNSTLKARTLFLQHLLDDFNRQALDKMAFTDMLTGANNRRSFKHLAENQLQLNPQCVSSLLLFDVDHFKIINDTHGHDAGDEVLKHIVNVTKSILRRQDIFARFGGEEFIILLPDTPLDTAVKIAERLRHHIAEQVLYIKDKNIQFTISIGLTSFFSNQTFLYSSIKQADLALYCAKKQGRNQVQIWNNQQHLKPSNI